MNEIPLKTFAISILANQSICKICFDEIFSVVLTLNSSITKFNLKYKTIYGVNIRPILDTHIIYIHDNNIGNNNFVGAKYII